MLYITSYSSHRRLKGISIVPSAVQSTRAPSEQVDIDLFDPPAPGHALSMRRRPETSKGDQDLSYPVNLGTGLEGQGISLKWR
jgi:hypothetical protein